MRLLDYIRGLRKGREAHRLEKESMQDPFLADAMDGYQQVEGNHEPSIEKLRRQVTARSLRKKNTRKNRNLHPLGWSVAACLVMGIGISLYFLFFKEELANDTLRIAKENAPHGLLQDVVEKKDTLSLAAAKRQQDSVPGTSAKETNKKNRIARARTIAPSPPAPPAAAAMVEVTSQDRVVHEEAPADTDTCHTGKNQKKAMKALYLSPNLIRGKVVDAQGDPIPGAYVLYTGTDVGTLTNVQGEFVLARKEGTKQLTARYIGYHSAQVPVDSGRPVLIALNEDNAVLNEVIVTKNETPRTPEPVIGKRKYKKYLKNNLNRPTEGKCKDVKGKVTLTFIVDEKGTPQHIIVLKSLCEEADKEAIRLVREGPKWTPGNLPARVTVRF